MYEINPNELPFRPPSSQPPISLSPQSSTGSGDAESSLPVYAQPDLSKKRSHQQVLEANTYSKLQRITITSPVHATSLERDPAYSHPEFSTPLPSHIPPSADLEYDELSSTAKLELKEKQPASKVAYYDTVAADVLSKPSQQSNPHPISNDIQARRQSLVKGGSYVGVRAWEKKKKNFIIHDHFDEYD